MSTTTVPLHHRLDGPEDAPVLVLSNSLGTSLDMWWPQVDALKSRFRLLRYDTRGHGQSPVPSGPYAIADLGRDVVALLDELGIARAHFAGLSLGGMTGMWLGAHAADRVDRLALLCTSAHIPPVQQWHERAALVRERGTEALAETLEGRWFTNGFGARDPEALQRMVSGLIATPDEGYVGCVGALATMDLREDLPRVTAPTLVIAGEEDPATPPDHARAIAAGIPGARLEILPGAAHLANVEQADRVTELLLEHFG
jgi:3-oxoadipate enol-lactonase